MSYRPNKIAVLQSKWQRMPKKTTKIHEIELTPRGFATIFLLFCLGQILSYGTIPSSDLSSKISLANSTSMPQISSSECINPSASFSNRSRSVSMGEYSGLDQKIKASIHIINMCAVQADGKHYAQRRNFSSKKSCFVSLNQICHLFCINKNATY